MIHQLVALSLISCTLNLFLKLIAHGFAHKHATNAAMKAVLSICKLQIPELTTKHCIFFSIFLQKSLMSFRGIKMLHHILRSSIFIGFVEKWN